MNKYRSAALILACSAASLSASACSAGISTATPPATSAPATNAPAPSRSASVAVSSSTPASSGRTITISGSIGSFPVPAGAKVAKVAENVGHGKAIIIVFSSVTPANVQSFYSTALPRAGYAISVNSIADQGGVTVAIIGFTGHGYKGDIGALSHFSGSGVPGSVASLPGIGTKNVTTIALTPK
jgi:hypothetical protein